MRKPVYNYAVADGEKFTVLDLLNMDLGEQDALDLVCLAGRAGLGREISVPDINRPGLALAGFYTAFAAERVQLFGQGEFYYLSRLELEGKSNLIKKYFSYQMPCIVFSGARTPSDAFLSLADASCCPVLRTHLSSSAFSQRALRLFANVFAPSVTIHGVFAEVYGVGILLTGESGIGKSETALELVERGHRLVADDVVELRSFYGNTLVGRGANSLISHHMEIRGLGIINVAQLYGIGAIRRQKEVQLEIRLAPPQADKVYDRIGDAREFTEYLGVRLPVIEIPVRPARNLPIIIEAAAMNERLKAMGFFPADEFNRNILRWIEIGSAGAAYYKNEDSY